jgi:hypothetical protein
MDQPESAKERVKDERQLGREREKERRIKELKRQTDSFRYVAGWE